MIENKKDSAEKNKPIRRLWAQNLLEITVFIKGDK
jgi:hypothetical protein